MEKDAGSSSELRSNLNHYDGSSDSQASSISYLSNLHSIHIGSEEARKALQGQKKFFFWAVHDLRNPCNSMEQATDQALAKLNMMDRLCHKARSFVKDAHAFHSKQE